MSLKTDVVNYHNQFIIKGKTDQNAEKEFPSRVSHGISEIYQEIFGENWVEKKTDERNVIYNFFTKFISKGHIDPHALRQILDSVTVDGNSARNIYGLAKCSVKLGLILAGNVNHNSIVSSLPKEIAHIILKNFIEVSLPDISRELGKCTLIQESSLRDRTSQIIQNLEFYTKYKSFGNWYSLKYKPQLQTYCDKLINSED